MEKYKPPNSVFFVSHYITEGFQGYSFFSRTAIASNQLSSLSLSANIDLIKPDCSHNRLTALSFSANKRLKRLNCLQNQIDEGAMQVVVENLHGVPQGGEPGLFIPFNPDSDK